MKMWTRMGCGIAVVGALMIGGTSGAARAAESADAPSHGLLGERFSLDVGWKFWVAKWQAQGNARQINATRTSDTTTLTGPSITGSFRLRDDEFLHTLGVNFTWLEAGGFNFTPFGSDLQVPQTGQSFPGPSDRTTAIRRDYSIVGTLGIWRGFGIFGGYYHMQQRFSSSFLTLAGNPNSSVWISGPVIGFYGNGTVTGRLKAYGNLSMGFFSEKTNDEGFNRVDAKGCQGYAAEMGLSLDGPSIKTGLGQIGSAIQMGFRAQVININHGGGANNDVTWGPTFQIVARF